MIRATILALLFIYAEVAIIFNLYPYNKVFGETLSVNSVKPPIDISISNRLTYTERPYIEDVLG